MPSSCHFRFLKALWLLILVASGLCQGQVVFEDSPSPQTQQFRQQGFPSPNQREFGSPNGFGQQQQQFGGNANNNNGFRPPSQQNQGFGQNGPSNNNKNNNGGFGNQNNNAGFNPENQNGQGFTQNNQGLGQNGQGFGQSNQGFGQNGQNSGQSGQGFGQSSQGFGQNNQGPGQNNQGFGQNNQGFGQNNQGSGQNNQGFGQNNQGFGQNNQGFGQNNQGSGQNNQGFGQNNQGFGQNKNPHATSRQPDCQTFHNDGGFCTPLQSCERLGRILRNRNPIMAARILRRSLCGFSGISPNVCCPMHRHNNNLPSENSIENFLNSNNNNNNNGGNNGPQNGGFGNNQTPFSQTTPFFRPPPPTTNRPPPPTTNRPPQPSSSLPFIGPTTGKPFGPINNNNNGPVTLIPPQVTKKPPPTGGLIIIGGGTTSTVPSVLIPDPGFRDDIVVPGFSSSGLSPECGSSNASHSKIVGGKPSQKGAWPWIAALGYKDDTGNVNFLCGGALISDRYIVTASHCVYKRKDLVSVRLGDYDIFSDGDGVTPLDVAVEQIIQHPKYDPGTFYNDIALLKLKTPVTFTPQVHPICLPSTPQLRSERFENNSPFVAGWGAVQFNGPSSSVLREVQVPIVPDSVCQDKFKSFKSVNVDDTNICAGLQAGGKDACQGDSGGPLMQPVGSNKYVLIGVVSFGFKCAEPGFPGVYSRVTSQLDWIENTIRGAS